MIQLHEVTKRYPGATTLALDSVRIHEIPGSHAILVGANETPIAKASIKAVADQIRGCLDEIPEGG